MEREETIDMAVLHQLEDVCEAGVDPDTKIAVLDVSDRLGRIAEGILGLVKYTEKK